MIPLLSFFADRPLPSWTREKADQYVRENLESAGLSGFHFDWHRKHLERQRLLRAATTRESFDTLTHATTIEAN